MSSTYRYTRNITRIARMAITAGGLSEWYADAWKVCADIDPSNPRRAAAVVAVLSPMSAWSLNVRNARAAYHAADNGVPMAQYVASARCLKRNARKAYAILHTASGFEAIVHGPKVEAFFANICGDAHKVTVDRHAIDIAHGKPLSDALRAKAIAHKSDRQTIIDSYVRAAAILSKNGKQYTPAQIQAITWVFWRNTLSQMRFNDSEAWV